MYIKDKEKTDIFVESYFKSLRSKQFLAIGFICIIYNIIAGKEESIVSIVVVIIITLLAFFIGPDLLRKETERSIQKFYDRIIECDDKTALICNLKKLNGPTFGALYIDKKKIEFLPFRDNLQSEGFVIDQSEIKNTKIAVCEIKNSVFNRVFFKELHKAISITYNSEKVILQMPEPEKNIGKIRKEICIN